MAWGWSKTRYSPIAIDFGADSLKLLQIVPSDPPQLVAAASVELPDQARLDPESRKTFFSQALKEALKSHPFKGRRAICSVPAYQTLVHHLQVSPSDDESVIESQIHQHLRQRLNVEPLRMVVRHFQVGQVIRDGTAKEEVICLAVSREAALGCISMVQRAKLEVVGMHSEPLAILRAFSHLYRRDNDANRVVCFVDLGSATTKVVIAHGTEMKFAKTIHFAGEHFTRSLAKAEGLTFCDARLARIQRVTDGVDQSSVPPASEQEPIVLGPPKRGGGVGGSGVSDLSPQSVARAAAVTETSTQQSPIVKPAVNNHLGDALDCLLDELLLCVRYHQSTFSNRPIEKIVFLGGESRQVWICQKIARTLRIGAQLGDPMARLVSVNQVRKSVGLDLRKPQPGWAVPVGLCLSEANL